MNQTIRTCFVLLLFCLPLAGFGQKTESKTEETSRASGLRKVASGRGVEVHINREQLEADIEAAVENALKSIEGALGQLEQLDIHIEPIEINLSRLNFDLDPIVINIPQLDINIEPLVIEPEELDMGEDHDEWNEEGEDEGDAEDAYQNDIRLKEKAKAGEDKSDKEKTESKKSVQEKSGKTDKQKSKGLKKIN